MKELFQLTAKFRNGDIIRIDIEACVPEQSLDEYGRLYNWYALDDARSLCPTDSPGGLHNRIRRVDAND